MKNTTFTWVALLASLSAFTVSAETAKPNGVTPQKAALCEKAVGQNLNSGSDQNMTQTERKAVTLTKPYPTSYKGATTDKIAVQYAVIELGKQAGLDYNWDASFKNTDPICREWVYPDIKNKPFRTAMKELLGPAGLTYELRENKIVLKRDAESDKNMTQAERKTVTLTKPYPISYKGATKDKIAVQYAVIELGKQAGLDYNWDASFKNTDPICREWVYPDIKNKPFRTAMKELLGPAGLTYELRENAVVLKKK